MGDLTTNFDSSEFDGASSGGAFPPQYQANELPLAQLAQWIRDGVGSFGEITSAYRTATTNADVGGSSTSQHMSGEALDLVYPLSSIYAISAFVLGSMADGSAPAFGQFIAYPADGHIHISLPTLSNNNQLLFEETAADGTQVYTPFTDPSQLPGYASVPSALPDLYNDVTSSPLVTVGIAAAVVGVAILLGGRTRRPAEE
jgi:Peptidase M15